MQIAAKMQGREASARHGDRDILTQNIIHQKCHKLSLVFTSIRSIIYLQVRYFAQTKSATLRRLERAPTFASRLCVAVSFFYSTLVLSVEI